MRLPICDQHQPRPYLAPFSHNTSVTVSQRDSNTNDNRTKNMTVT